MSKNLILYYSQSGNTQTMVNLISQVIDCDTCQIEPLTPYSTNYETMLKEVRLQQEQNQDVAYKPVDIDLDAYDTILVGTPNWSGSLALPLRTFIKEHDFTNKKILPFLSHAGTGKEDIETELKEICNATVAPCFSTYKSLEEMEVSDIIEWIHSNM